MSDYIYDDNEEQSFFRKYRFAIGGLVFVLLIGAIGLSAYLFTGKIPPPRKPAEITISLPPPPPPPPPPPTPPPPKPPPEQKPVEVTPIKPVDKPKDVAKAPDKAPGPPGPKATGPASDDGLGGNGSGNGDGIGGNGGANPYAVYAGELQEAVKRALEQNGKTNRVSISHLRVRVWISAGGRITRATLAQSSGDPTIDEAIKNEVLPNVQLPDASPSGKSIWFDTVINAEHRQ